MSWPAVNSPQLMIHEDLSANDFNEETATKTPLSVASKFRVNILAAADSISERVPKRRRSSVRMSKAVREKIKWGEPLPEKPGVSKQPTRKKRKIATPDDSAAVAKADSPDHEAHVQTKLFSDAVVSSAHVKADDIVVMQEKQEMDPGERNFKLASGNLLSPNHIPEPGTTPNTNVIEISSDDDQSFEEFDFSDRDLEEHFRPSLSSNLTSLGSSSPKLIDSTPLTNKQPTDAVIAPFMHPNLLYDDLFYDISSQTEKRFTCFRAGELLRLSKRLQTVDPVHSIKIELFAKVQEVRFADNKGRGQGIILADIFFPTRPPFVATTSRTPLNVRSLQSSIDHEVLVLAVISLDSAQPRSNATKRLVSPNAIRPTSSAQAGGFELLEIRQSSWDEIREVRLMIEKDIRATEAGGSVEPQISRPSGAPPKTIDMSLDEMAVEQLTGMVELAENEEF